ncbi:ATP-binding protein [Pseudonocardia dioxanivorans]|uniref:ATP-binding protein n=1 Tax=Pseudonocardia dioxanivorans TaxID=240495 RepID=UPI000CD1ED94|nr:LuxR family transcriptional regulator [Pseudonocardia dioxanivorans]
MSDGVHAPGAVAMVGRDDELARVDAALGRGGLVLVCGEPGIGKTTLLSAVAGRVRGRGYDTVWGRCRETPGAPALHPWAQVVRGLGGTSPGLEPLLSPRPSHTDRYVLFEAVADLLADRPRPLAVLLDDMHRADEASVLLLDFLVPVLPGSGVLVVAAWRDTEPARAPQLTRLAEHTSTDLVRLTGLSPAAVGAMARAAGGDVDAADLWARCAGNPYFVAEVLRLPDATPVPPTVAATIEARTNGLPRRTRDALAAGAVIGRDVPPDLLADLLDLPDEAVADAALAPAVTAGLLRAVPGGYRFAHVLVRDAVEDRLAPDRRARLHDRLADVPDGLLTAAERAEHATRVVRTPRERARAARLAVAAARDAAVRLAHEEAESWLRRALAVTPPTPAARFPLLLELGAAAGRAGSTPRAREAYEEAWRTVEGERSGRPAQVALGLGEVVDSAGTVDGGLVRMLEHALDVLPPTARSTRVALLARLATEIYWGPRLDEARTLAADAVAAARRLGDARSLAAALAAMQFTLRGPGRTAERTRTGRELVRIAQQLGDVPMETAARKLLVADAFLCDPATVDHELGALESLAAQSRRPHAHWSALVGRAALACLRGPAEDALDAIERMEWAGARIGARPAPMYGAAQRLFVLRRSGRASEAADDLYAAAAAYPRLVTLRCGMALLHASTGRRADAAAELDALTADDCAAIPFDALRMSALTQLAETAVLLGHRPAAAALRRALTPHSGTLVLQGLVVWMGAVDHYLGTVAAVLGDEADARRLLDRAVRRHQEWGAPVLEAASRRALRTATAPALTEREREILDLVAGGSANKEIARRLGISVHTVERHVANGYSKIGVRNRAEATAHMLRGR